MRGVVLLHVRQNAFRVMPGPFRTNLPDVNPPRPTSETAKSRNQSFPFDRRGGAAARSCASVPSRGATGGGSEFV